MLVAQHLIESTLFACAVAIIAYSLRKHSAAVRYALWSLAVAKFVMPVALLAQLGTACKSLLPLRYSFLVNTGLPATLYPTLSRSAATLYPTLSRSAATPMPVQSHWLLLLLAALWLGGSVTLCVLWIYKSLALRKTLKACIAVNLDLLTRLQLRLSIQSPIALQYSPAASPDSVLCGIIHPTIRIPEGLSSQLTPLEFEAILLHELAHVRRYDNLCGAFVHCVVCAFWFHPLLWWMEQRLLIERERACDELVIHHGATAETYVAGILKVCRFQLTKAVAGTSAMTSSDLTHRMELIMSYPSQLLVSRLSRLIIGGFAALMTIVPLAIGFFQHSAFAAQLGVNGQRVSNVKQGACAFHSENYRAGTILQMGEKPGSPIRECANGKWTASRGSKTVIAKDPPAVACQALPSIAPNACRCQDGSYSLGAITKAADQTFIRCDRFELGKVSLWRPATPRELSAK